MDLLWTCCTVHLFEFDRPTDQHFNNFGTHYDNFDVSAVCCTTNVASAVALFCHVLIKK